MLIKGLGHRQMIREGLVEISEFRGEDLEKVHFVNKQRIRYYIGEFNQPYLMRENVKEC